MTSLIDENTTQHARLMELYTVMQNVGASSKGDLLAQHTEHIYSLNSAE